MANKARRFIADTSHSTEYSELRLQSVMRKAEAHGFTVGFTDKEILRIHNDVNHKRASKQYQNFVPIYSVRPHLIERCRKETHHPNSYYSTIQL